MDQDGQTLEILVQKRRNTKAAQRFFRKLLKGLRYVPNRLVTDKLRSMPTTEQRSLINTPVNANDRRVATS